MHHSDYLTAPSDTILRRAAYLEIGESDTNPCRRLNTETLASHLSRFSAGNTIHYTHRLFRPLLNHTIDLVDLVYRRPLEEGIGSMIIIIAIRHTSDSEIVRFGTGI